MSVSPVAPEAFLAAHPEYAARGRRGEGRAGGVGRPDARGDG